MENQPTSSFGALQEQPDRTLDLATVLAWMEDDGLVDPENARLLRNLTADAAPDERHPLECIAERNCKNPVTGRVLTLEELSAWFAGRISMPFERIDPLTIDMARVTEVMSYAYAARFNVLPIRVDAKTITIATAQPYEREWLHELSRIHDQTFELVVTNPQDIRRYLLEFYTVSKSVLGAQARAQPALGSMQNLEQLTELGRSGELDADDQHVVSIVDWLLQYAFDQRASDIHLEPRREMSNVRFRIDGVMHDVYQIPTTVMAAVESRIKILGRMDVAEKRRPQDGRLKTRTPDGREVELRLSTMPTAFGEKMVMRIFDPEVLVRNFQEMGFTPNDETLWRSMIEQPHGIVLVTGPTGSGKTTTLYSTLKLLSKPEVNVCTIEDPIELVEPAFNQMQVQKNIDLDFSAGIRTLLRQDPDIIMIGEIRDMETAEMAVQAALTGHLVLSTLHTNDAPSAITRLLDIGVPSYLIQSSVLGVMAQRLIRTLCAHCKKPSPLSPKDWQALVQPWKPLKPEFVYQPVGCLECRDTGYRGRLGIYEMFAFGPTTQPLVTAGCDIDALRRAVIKDGLRPLRLSGANKVAAGLTTIEEIMRVAPPPLQSHS